ncbi:MAG TPA: hypothetical protein VM936_13975 [Pyrinomonadaceae bacterium]|jgi:hypothetical protein|nr:hypothetical protein [Pyrinomonadaceae bacterium]
MLRRLLVCAALLCVASGRASGQGGVGPDPAAPSFVRLGDAGADAARLLNSGENRERAWGAYLVGLHAMKEQTPSLVSILQDESLNGGGRVESAVRQAALDSLIRLDAEAPSDVLLPLYAYSPNEVLILLARSPQENQAALLTLFTDNEPPARWFAAGNLLAEMRAPGFAARVLAGLKITASVYVFDREEHDGIGVGGGCGGCGFGMDWSPDAELPPVGYYALDYVPSLGATVVARGRHVIYYTRVLYPAQGAGGGCGFDRDAARVEYLAGLLYTEEDSLGFSAYPYHEVTCEDLAGCGRALAGVRDEVANSYGVLLDRLLGDGLLDAAEASQLKPDITLNITDLRDVKTFPLPDKFRGAKVSVTAFDSEPENTEDPAAAEGDPPPDAPR